MKARIPGAPQGGNNMMKKIQEMQENMQKIQQEVEATEFSSTVGGGAVEVVVTGAHEVTAVNLKPEVVDPEDVEILSDMIIAATNEAIRKAADTMEQRMGSATSGMGLPAGLGF